MRPAVNVGTELVSAQHMVLKINQIKPYDRNPRRALNDRYLDIKESIRAQKGLNTPLKVTRRPGESIYMLEAGGNTRLMVLHELWEETHQDCFYTAHCLFVPWQSDSHVISAQQWIAG